MTIKTLESINRFDLEQDIMNCWQVVDDIRILSKRYLDGPEMTVDEVSTVLLGIELLYQLKFEQLFSTFEQCIKNNQFKEYQAYDFSFKPRESYIEILQKEINYLRSQITEHDSGHLYTTISVLENRIKEIRND